MTAVWKFPLAVEDTQTIDIPKGAYLLHVAAQSDVPCLWALVNPEAATEQRTFTTVGTGHPVALNDAYVGSYQLDEGAFVGHLFERTGSVTE